MLFFVGFPLRSGESLYLENLSGRTHCGVLKVTVLCNNQNTALPFPVRPFVSSLSKISTDLGMPIHKRPAVVHWFRRENLEQVFRHFLSENKGLQLVLAVLETKNSYYSESCVGGCLHSYMYIQACGLLGD